MSRRKSRTWLAEHRDRLYGALQTALVHLLKWQFQPYRRSNGWRASVVVSVTLILP
jgi:hypothetical protein